LGNELSEVRGNTSFSADHHQKYLAKDPDRYCGIGGCGVAFKPAEMEVEKKA
jgi:peptide methionine sulfoxide reductase MsrA